VGAHARKVAPWAGTESSTSTLITSPSGSHVAARTMHRALRNDMWERRGVAIIYAALIAPRRPLRRASLVTVVLDIYLTRERANVGG
jgi:hypothetical protein